MKVLYNDVHVGEINDHAEELEVIRHDAALTQAEASVPTHSLPMVQQPKTVYYDVDLGDYQRLARTFPAIEAEMKKIVKRNLKIETFELPSR